MSPRLVVLLLLAGACTRAGDTVPTHPPAQQRSVLAEPPAQDVGAPLKVTWREEHLGPDGAIVVARIERFSMGALKLHARVELPPGVETEEPLEFDVPQAEAPAVFERTFRLRYRSIPDGEALLIVEAREDDFGFHARVPYRFGRPAPQEPSPEATGPRVRMGERDFGPAVPMQK